MDREGNTDVHLTPLDGNGSTVILKHNEPTIPFTQRKIPFWPEETEVDMQDAKLKYVWKGDKRLEPKKGSNPNELGPIATFRHNQEKHTSKCGILHVHAGQKIGVELVIITALVVQARADKFGK